LKRRAPDPDQDNRPGQPVVWAKAIARPGLALTIQFVANQQPDDLRKQQRRV
jgi:hypothetical protein